MVELVFLFVRRYKKRNNKAQIQESSSIMDSRNPTFPHLFFIIFVFFCISHVDRDVDAVRVFVGKTTPNDPTASFLPGTKNIARLSMISPTVPEDPSPLPRERPNRSERRSPPPFLTEPYILPGDPP